MKNRDCAECVRLWQEYAAATIEHVQYDNKRKLATLRRQSGDFDVIARMTQDAEQRRNLVRELINTHEAMVHSPNVPESTTSE